MNVDYYFRGVVKFNPISLPSGACNIHAKLLVSVDNHNSVEKHWYVVRQLPSNFGINSPNPDWFFHEVDKCPSIDGLNGAIRDGESKEYDITSLVIGNETMFFGATELDDFGWKNNLHFKIIVKYDMPVNISINNYPEGGTIKVGDNMLPTSQLSGHSFITSTGGNQINLEAVQVTDQYPKRIWDSNSNWKGKDNESGIEFYYLNRLLVVTPQMKVNEI